MKRKFSIHSVSIVSLSRSFELAWSAIQGRRAQHTESALEAYNNERSYRKRVCPEAGALSATLEISSTLRRAQKTERGPHVFLYIYLNDFIDKL